MNRFVVSGTGHSGTAWLALAFSFLGVPTTHEGIFTLRGRMDWPDGLRADVSLAAMPYLQGFDGDALIVIRDPLAVFNSFYRGRTFARTCPCHNPGAHLGSPFVRYLLEHGRLAVTDDEVGLTIRHIVGWVELGNDGDRRVPVARLEDVRAGELAVWAERFAVVPTRQTRTLLDGKWLPSDVNAHGPVGNPRPWMTWADIDSHPDGHLLREQAERFGYL